MPVSVSPLAGGAVQNANLDLPNTCPLCNRDIHTEANIFQSCTYADWVEILVRCPNRLCRHAFIAFYVRVQGINFRHVSSAPANPPVPQFDDSVSNLSPNFVRIFGQAAAAEAQNLDDVAGPGFRKALEFLLKDYAVSLCPADAEMIKKSQLGSVIKKYFTEQRMSVVCSRAAWLGNDETHYEKRWIGKDLADLKKLIMASVHFIAMERLAADLPMDMPDKP